MNGHQTIECSWVGNISLKREDWWSEVLSIYRYKMWRTDLDQNVWVWPPNYPVSLKKVSFSWKSVKSVKCKFDCSKLVISFRGAIGSSNVEPREWIVTWDAKLGIGNPGGLSLNTEKWREYEIEAVSDHDTQCSLILESWGVPKKESLQEKKTFFCDKASLIH